MSSSSEHTHDEEHWSKDESTPQYEAINYIDQQDVETLTRIATQQSRRQSTIPAHRLASVAQHDPTLDPSSKEFNLQKWLGAAMSASRKDNTHRGQNLGVVFKQLNVYGSGAALQFQGTVDSMLTAPLRIPQVIRESHAPKRRILKDFNGLIKKGELLLVLGRPGSGCSTLLKSICGELHGLELDKESTIHYNGIPQSRMIKEYKGEVVYNQEVNTILSTGLNIQSRLLTISYVRSIAISPI